MSVVGRCATTPGQTQIAKFAHPLHQRPELALTGGARCPKAFPQLSVKLPCGAPAPIRAHDPKRTAAL
jgi:hypothetical protein